MSQQTAKAVLGDNYIIISGEVTPRELSVGWPGSAEAEGIFLLTPKGELVDITELLYSVLGKGNDLWDDLSQKLYEDGEVS